MLIKNQAVLHFGKNVFAVTKQQSMKVIETSLRKRQQQITTFKNTKIIKVNKYQYILVIRDDTIKNKKKDVKARGEKF